VLLRHTDDDRRKWTAYGMRTHSRLTSSLPMSASSKEAPSRFVPTKVVPAASVLQTLATVVHCESHTHLTADQRLDLPVMTAFVKLVLLRSALSKATRSTTALVKSAPATKISHC
jgi:hypothetical protein